MLTIRGEVTWQRDVETGEWKITPAGENQESKENSADITISELAAQQLRDYLRHAPGTYFAEEHPPLQLEEAYGVQAEVARLRSLAGESIAGYKIGCVGPKIREQFGLSGPIRGFLFKS
jgi:2-keto-4-pentenoate hydratase